MMKSINVPVYSAEDIDIILSQIDVVETMRQAFLNLAHGQAAQPDQKVIMFPNQGGDCIGYFGIDTSSKVLGVKMSPYIITNEKPLVTAWTLLLSTENGQPLMLCDSQRLTIERTAATTVLAVDELARKDARVLTVIGTGGDRVGTCSPCVGYPSVGAYPDLQQKSGGCAGFDSCTSSG
ncbi:hypothetical protein LNO17_25960 [Klebsiella pneumoniae subsp. pneumoniae]|nr:hypothetical protein [Klebsiella pneumoniae subsp. pneumoniae]